MPTIADLTDYLNQFDSDTAVVLTGADVDEPGEFIALDSALAEMSAS